jgi:membrane protease YdiL (CAAX protease family)
MVSVSSESVTPSWGVRDIVLGSVSYGAIFVLLLGSVRLVTWYEFIIPNELKPIVNGLVTLLLEALLLLPVWFFAIVWTGGTWRAVGFRRVGVAHGCWLPCLFLFVAYGITILWGLVLLWMQWPRQSPLVPLFRDNPIAIALGVMAVCVAAPIGEETFFRGFVMGGLRARIGMLQALFVSAAFFALLHLPITLFPAIFGLGLLLGSLFAHTNSLWPGIILHATFNTIGFVAQFVLVR